MRERGQTGGGLGAAQRIREGDGRLVAQVGQVLVQAVQQLDYTVIMGTTVFYGAFLVFMVILVDIAYGLVDPRIRVAQAR